MVRPSRQEGGAAGRERAQGTAGRERAQGTVSRECGFGDSFAAKWP